MLISRVHRVPSLPQASLLMVVLVGTALEVSCSSTPTNSPYSAQSGSTSTTAGTLGGTAVQTSANGTSVTTQGTASSATTGGESAAGSSTATLGGGVTTSTVAGTLTSGSTTGSVNNVTTGSGGAGNVTGATTSNVANTSAITTAANVTSTTGASTGSCNGSSVTVNRYPLGCTFSWGAPDDPNLGIDMVSTWVGYEDNGGLDGDCNGCNMVGDVAGGGPVVIYYAYFIGYQARLMAGYGDCNVDMDAETLCTRGAQWIRDNRSLIVEMYGNYARMTYEASPNKGTIWWLEGDFVQYSYADQSNPLSMQELGDLARDITCAIKANQPNASVAMNHAPWIPNEESEAFWSAMPTDVLDMVWVQGPGDSASFINAAEYNAETANFAWLSQKTGMTIMAETSFAGQGQDDRWSTASASAINQRIAEGVIGVLVNNPSGNYVSTVSNLGGQLSSVCQ